MFLIKHLLILREQISAFDINFTVTEVSLDWTRTKGWFQKIARLLSRGIFFYNVAAAFGLLQKKSRLFSLSGNNAFLEFFIEGTPEIVETHMDSKKVSLID